MNITAEDARKHWLPYAVYASEGEYRVFKHIRRMSNAIERCVTGENQSRRLAIEIPSQHGKQIRHNTPILTSNRGWTTHGELVPGDYVFGRNGEPAKVLAISEDSIANCRVHFIDGDYIDCHENHEWLMYTRSGKPGEKIFETKKLESLKLWTNNPTANGMGCKRLYKNPHCGPIDGKSSLPMDPYLLGTWIGDGAASGRYFTCFDAADHQGFDDIVSRLDLQGLNKWVHGETGVVYASCHKFVTLLKEIGLYKSKHIPDVYFSASAADRLELLAGLMDTDGYFYHVNGRGTYSTASPQVAEDVATLIASFGWRPTKHWQKPSRSELAEGKLECCQVTFNHDIPIPCRIPRKLASQKMSKTQMISVDRIERIEPFVGRCIQVEGGLYRVGRRFKLTHNSDLCSRYFPVWYYGMNPKHQIGLVSHGQELANNFGEKNRELFERTSKEVFGLTLDKKSSRRENWRAKGYPNGGVVSVGVGGSLIGKRLDGMIIDDPFKNAAQANSPAEREKIWDFYGAIAQARLTKNAWVIAIHQRLHAEDFIGRVRMLNEDLPANEKWEILSMPAIAVEDEFWEDGKPFRSKGEALWPEFKPLSFIEQQRRTMTDYYFNCIYQQKPTQFEGTMWAPSLFDDQILVDTWPQHLDNLVIALDPASGRDTAKGDYPALVALGTCGDGYLYAEAFMQRQSPKLVAESIPQFARTLPRTPDLLLCERTLLQELYTEQIAGSMERNGCMFPICPLDHGGVNKMDRIMRLDPLISHREFRLVRSRGTSILIQQLKNFPHPQEHDDGPDALEMCIRGLRFVHATKA